MARPSILTDQLRAHIEGELATGSTQAVVSQRTGVKSRSLERWLAEGKITRHRIEPEPESHRQNGWSRPSLSWSL